MENSSKAILILNLLKALALNFNLLDYYGAHVNKPVLALVENGETNNVVDLLSSYGSRTLAEYDRLNITKEQILSTNSGAAIFSYDANPKAKELLDLISRIAATHTLDGEKVSCLFVVVSEVVPNDTNLDDFFTVEIPSVQCITEISNDILIPDSRNVPYIINKLSSLDSSLSDIDKALTSTLELLKPNLNEEDTQLYVDVISDLIKRDGLNKDLYDISEVFVSRLYSWQEHTQFEKAYELPTLPDSALENFDDIMTYNKDFVYLKDTLLKAICEYAFRDIAYLKIKNALCNEGIIIPDNTDLKTFTCNMGYETEEGKYERVRMTRLNRHKLVKPGEMEFAELCTANINEEENIYD